MLLQKVDELPMKAGQEVQSLKVRTASHVTLERLKTNWKMEIVKTINGKTVNGKNVNGKTVNGKNANDKILNSKNAKVKMQVAYIFSLQMVKIIDLLKLFLVSSNSCI